jgi:4-hydroxy-tetrahydrodipicolinate synthase
VPTEKKIQGAFTGVLTLFNEDATINHDGIRAYVDFLIGKGSKHLLIGASEFHDLTEEEARQVTRTVVDAADGRAIVLTTVGHCWADVAAEYAKYVEAVGADGLLVITPFYPDRPYNPVVHDDAFCRHFETIAEASDIPLLFYEKAIVAGGIRRLHSLEFIERVAAMEQVVGMKEQSGDEYYFYEILRRVGDKIAVIDDVSERSFFFTYKWGASGFISYMVGFPEVGLKFYDLLMNEDFAGARRIVTDIVVPFVSTMRSMGFRASARAVLEMRALPGGPVRPPGVSLTPVQKAKLQRTLEELGLLPEPRL